METPLYSLKLMQIAFSTDFTAMLAPFVCVFVPRRAAVPAVRAPAVFGVSDCPESPPASDT